MHRVPANELIETSFLLRNVDGPELPPIASFCDVPDIRRRLYGDLCGVTQFETNVREVSSFQGRTAAFQPQTLMGTTSLPSVEKQALRLLLPHKPSGNPEESIKGLPVVLSEPPPQLSLLWASSTLESPSQIFEELTGKPPILGL